MVPDRKVEWWSQPDLGPSQRGGCGRASRLERLWRVQPKQQVVGHEHRHPMLILGGWLLEMSAFLRAYGRSGFAWAHRHLEGLPFAGYRLLAPRRAIVG